MPKWSGLFIAGIALFTLAPGVSFAARPKTGYVDPITSPPPVNVAPSIGSGTVIFFNRKGGTYTYGESDSRTNSNNIGEGTLTPFECGDDQWREIMACLKDSFLPYNVKITDVDPGNAEHVETVVAGAPEELGQDHNVGGIAPLGCGLAYDNPVTFAFSQAFGCDVNEICWAAAQETAHAFGLDHSTECTDHMTYDHDCSNVKRFRDIDRACGEDEDAPPNAPPPNISGPRPCNCTGASSQNSHRDLLAIFGPRQNAAATVSFTRPRHGSAVTKGFAIEVAIDDDFGVASVEFYLDGQKIETKISAPFATTAPTTISDGDHTLTAKAIDQGGLSSEATIRVRVQPPCVSNDECPSSAVCQQGECIDGPHSPGGLGAACESSPECQSGICAPGPGGSRCTEICDPAASTCPDGFDCLSAGTQSACWPGADVLASPDSGCGCRVGAGARRVPLVGFLLGFVGFGLALRRRR